MAQFVSDASMNFSGFNLSILFSSYGQFGFLDSINLVVDNTVVPGFEGTYFASDIAVLYNGSSPSSSSDHLILAGDNLSFDGAGIPLSGTFTGFYQLNPTGESTAMAGFELDMVEVYAAAQTTSVADDRAILNQMLSGGDRILCSDFGDQVFGAAGHDLIVGEAGHDTLAGDGGDDSLLGGTGNDLLNGGAGADSLAGNSGADTLLGGAGNDRLLGQAGADRLQGGAGRDVIYGGIDSDRDVFVFVAVADSVADATRDAIYNFVSGTDDIHLGAIDADTATGGNQSFGFSGQTAADNSVWYTVVSGNAVVRADVTGDGIADFSLRLVGVTSLSAGDFVL